MADSLQPYPSTKGISTALMARCASDSHSSEGLDATMIDRLALMKSRFIGVKTEGEFPGRVMSNFRR
ncbi:hypothetical protein [Streptomyces sp. NPDC127112]|uniref:hypothetical protein n=1 Tax=Streptomyces sp. NPDC127112 TaxID=3345364 RepID=UPI003636B348